MAFDAELPATKKAVKTAGAKLAKALAERRRQEEMERYVAQSRRYGC